MPAEVRLHPEAERELRAAFLWYFERNLLAAESFQAEVAHAIEAVARDPKRWPKICCRLEADSSVLLLFADRLSGQSLYVVHQSVVRCLTHNL